MGQSWFRPSSASSAGHSVTYRIPLAESGIEHGSKMIHFFQNVLAIWELDILVTCQILTDLVLWRGQQGSNKQLNEPKLNKSIIVGPPTCRGRLSQSGRMNSLRTIQKGSQNSLEGNTLSRPSINWVRLRTRTKPKPHKTTLFIALHQSSLDRHKP